MLLLAEPLESGDEVGMIAVMHARLQRHAGSRDQSLSVIVRRVADSQLTRTQWDSFWRVSSIAE